MRKPHPRAIAQDGQQEGFACYNPVPQTTRLADRNWYSLQRDVTFYENTTRTTIGDAGRILTTVHNLVLGLIKQVENKKSALARRYFEDHIGEAFSLLITVNSRS